MLMMLALLCLQAGDIESLLKQLSDDRLERREQATAALLELGEKADGAIRKFGESATPEAQARCQVILDRLDERRRLARVLPPLELVSMNERDASVRTLLETLAKRTGLPLDLAMVPDKKVTCHFRNFTPLEALDSICRTAGIAWQCSVREGSRSWPPREQKDANPRIILGVGDHEEPLSRCFVRQYMVSVEGITSSRTRLVREKSSLTRMLFGVYWPPHVKPAGDPRIEWKSVVDDQGQSLLPGKGFNPAYVAYDGGLDPPQARWRVSDMFLPAAKGATRIAFVKGSLSLRYSLGRERLIFSDLVEGATKTHQDVTVELVTVAIKDGEVRIDCRVSGDLRHLTSVGVGDMMGNSLFSLKDKLGTVHEAANANPTISVRGSDWQQVATTFRCEFKNVRAELSSFEIEFDTASHIDTFDFELKDIDLP